MFLVYFSNKKILRILWLCYNWYVGLAQLSGFLMEADEIIALQDISI